MLLNQVHCVMGMIQTDPSRSGVSEMEGKYEYVLSVESEREEGREIEVGERETERESERGRLR